MRLYIKQLKKDGRMNRIFKISKDDHLNCIIN